MVKPSWYSMDEIPHTMDSWHFSLKCYLPTKLSKMCPMITCGKCHTCMLHSVQICSMFHQPERATNKSFSWWSNIDLGRNYYKGEKIKKLSHIHICFLVVPNICWYIPYWQQNTGEKLEKSFCRVQMAKALTWKRWPVFCVRAFSQHFWSLMKKDSLS